MKIIHQPEAEIPVHEVGKYGNSHGQLDPTLCMREVVQALNRVPACVKRLAFHPDIFFVKRRYFSLQDAWQHGICLLRMLMMSNCKNNLQSRINEPPL